MKLSFEMTWPELLMACTDSAGVPPPLDNASREDWDAWVVLSVVQIHRRSGAYADPACADVAAVNALLNWPDSLRRVPLIERAIGRQLTEQEVQARGIATI